MPDIDLDLDQDQDWFIRENLEFDEKLPLLAYEVIERGIDFFQLDRDEHADPKVVKQIIEVMETFLDGFAELTGDEIDCFILRIVVACAIEYYLSEGLEEQLFSQTEDGEFYLTGEVDIPGGIES